MQSQIRVHEAGPAGREGSKQSSGTARKVESVRIGGELRGFWQHHRKATQHRDERRSRTRPVFVHEARVTIERVRAPVACAGRPRTCSVTTELKRVPARGP